MGERLCLYGRHAASYLHPARAVFKWWPRRRKLGRRPTLDKPPAPMGSGAHPSGVSSRPSSSWTPAPKARQSWTHVEKRSKWMSCLVFRQGVRSYLQGVSRSRPPGEICPSENFPAKLLDLNESLSCGVAKQRCCALFRAPRRSAQLLPPVNRWQHALASTHPAQVGRATASGGERRQSYRVVHARPHIHGVRVCSSVEHWHRSRDRTWSNGARAAACSASAGVDSARAGSASPPAPAQPRSAR